MSDRDRPDDERPDAPWPIETPDDVYELRDWVENYAPDWMDGLHFDVMAALDHYGLGDVEPENWSGATIMHSPDADDPWIVEIVTDSGDVVEVDLGDNWDAAWSFFSWIEAQGIDVEREVEY